MGTGKVYFFVVLESAVREPTKLSIPISRHSSTLLKSIRKHQIHQILPKCEDSPYLNWLHGKRYSSTLIDDRETHPAS